MPGRHSYFWFFFFNDTATTEIYTLSLHDALPIYVPRPYLTDKEVRYLTIPKGSLDEAERLEIESHVNQDRKSTRLNSSHLVISYAVFCLKKKTQVSVEILLVLQIYGMTERWPAER